MSQLDIPSMMAASVMERGDAPGCGAIVAELLDFAFDLLGASVPFDRIMLALLDPEHRTLRVEWMRAELRHPRIRPGFVFPVASSTLEEVISSGVHRVLDDVVKAVGDVSPQARAMITAEQIRSSLAMPITSGGQVRGVLFFSSRRLATFTDAHLGPARSLAQRVSRSLAVRERCGRSGVEALARAASRSGVIAQALDDTPAGRPLIDVTTAVERAHDELRINAAIVESINKGTLFADVLDRVYESFQGFLPLDRLGFARLDGDKVRAVWGRNDTAPLQIDVGYTLLVAQTSLGEVLASRRPRILNDLRGYLQAHPHSDPTKRIVREGMRSSLTCPLFANGEAIGLLFFASRQKDAYDAHHVTVFQRVANSVAVAVEKGWTHKRLLEAYQESDKLLHNTLPPAIADRLKRGGGVIADYHADVTVLFADIVGFSTLAARMSPTEVVSMLNRIFSAFDELTAAAGVEKIKTIGDAYLAVGGLSGGRSDHARVVCDLAFGMLDIVRHERGPFNESIELRIGLHSGPVTAGVIGKHKFGYDLWGDTVNVASRMQSHGLPGQVQVTARTAELLRDRYHLRPRGLVTVKGARSVASFLVEGPKTR